MLDRQALINWCSQKVVAAYRLEAAERARPEARWNHAWLERSDELRAERDRWRALRWQVAAGRYSAIDCVRTYMSEVEIGTQ